MYPRTGTLLVVDDNPRTRELLRAYLERAKHTVFEAEDGQQALECMRHQNFDLMLLDIMMPGLSGIQILEKLRADASMAHTPVVVISAIDDIESIIQAIALGAEDYLVKPFNQRMLHARVQAILEKKWLRDREQALLRELGVMQEIDRELNSGLDLQTTLELTLQRAIRHSKAAAGFIGLLETGTLRIVAEQHDEHDGASGQFRADKWLAAMPSTFSETLTCQESLYQDSQTSVIVPICRDGEVISLLVLDYAPPHLPSEDTSRFLNRLREHAAIAISNAQYYQEAKAANEAKNEFIAFASHELKNQMTNIRGFAELLIGDLPSVTELQAKSLEIIRANIDTMVTLLSDLGDISQIESRYLALNIVDLSLSDMMDEVLLYTSKTYQDKRHAVRIEMPDDLPKLRADRVRLSQILTNLLSNAIKYTPDGGKITIQAALSSNHWDAKGAPDVIHIQIIDNGIGIRDEDQPRIFQMFFRSSDARNQRILGTGLGLHITKQLVELQGGRIWFESTHGQGTVFHFTLPVAH